jgi:hypothetical protein
MEKMNITSAQYKTRDTYDDGGNIVSTTNSAIIAVINGETLGIPITKGNRHYDEIMRQVEAGELTIADAE